MGYRITYENGTIRKQSLGVRRIKWKRWVVGIVGAALAVVLMVPQGRLRLRDLLLPGDEKITAAALERMVNDLRAGEPLEEAVETFCKEILDNGA